MEYRGDLRKRCFTFSVEIVRFVRQQRVVYRSILDQLLRSATSIGANVAEASAASSRKEFIRFNEYSLRSANETIYWLRLILEGYEISTEHLKRLLHECDQLSRILGTIVVRLKS